MTESYSPPRRAFGANVSERETKTPVGAKLVRWTTKAHNRPRPFLCSYLIDCGDGPEGTRRHSPATGGSLRRSRAVRPPLATSVARSAGSTRWRPRRFATGWPSLATVPEPRQGQRMSRWAPALLAVAALASARARRATRAIGRARGAPRMWSASGRCAPTPPPSSRVVATGAAARRRSATRRSPTSAASSPCRPTPTLPRTSPTRPPTRCSRRSARWVTRTPCASTSSTPAPRPTRRCARTSSSGAGGRVASRRGRPSAANHWRLVRPTDD